MKTNVQELFVDLFTNSEDVSNTINWENVRNGTGYFDGLMNYKLPHGQLVSAIDPGTKRRILIIGKGEESAVVFERYTPNTDSPFVLVSNLPGNMESVFQAPSGRYDAELLQQVIDHQLVDEDDMDIENWCERKIKQMITDHENSQNKDLRGSYTLLLSRINTAISEKLNEV